MSLVSYLPPLPPLLHTSQLTETWQWPTCMCWQPKLTLLVWSQCWDWGKSCLLLLFHSWNFLGLQYCPAPLEQSLPSWDAQPICSVTILTPGAELLLALHSLGGTFLPAAWGCSAGSPGLDSDIILEQLQKESAISCLMASNAHMQAGHCCLLWLCLFCRSRCRCV